MPTINMPTRPESPLGGLLGIVNAVSGLKKNSAESDVLAEKAKSETLANQQAKLTQDTSMAQMKALQTPGSPEGEALKRGLIGSIALGQQAFPVKDPNAQSALSQTISSLKDPNLTGWQAKQMADASPLVASLKDFGDKQIQANAMAMAASMKANVGNVRNQSQANQQYSQEMGPFEGTINSANRVHGIIAQIKNGGLKSTPTLGNDLSSAVASMFNQGKAATVSGQEHNTLSSLEGNAANKWGYIEGKPMNTIAPEQLDQLDKDVSALRNEYSTAHQNVFDSFKEGLDPSLQKGLQKRFDSFRKSSVNSKFQNNEPTAYVPTPQEAAAELANRKNKK